MQSLQVAHAYLHGESSVPGRLDDGTLVSKVCSTIYTASCRDNAGVVTGMQTAVGEAVQAAQHRCTCMLAAVEPVSYVASSYMYHVMPQLSSKRAEGLSGPEPHCHMRE